MTLKEIGISEKKIPQFNRAGIVSAEDLITYWPRKYHDRSKLTGLLPKEQESVFVMHVRYANIRYYAKTLVEATGFEVETNAPVKVVWFNQDYIYNKVNVLVKQDVLVCGKATFVPATESYAEYYQVVNPVVFTRFDKKDLRIYPTYRKIKGMSEEFLVNSIEKAAIAMAGVKDTIPDRIRIDNKLISYARMLYELHWPSVPEALEAALRRKRWDDLLYFATRIELNRRYTAAGSAFSVPLTRTMKMVEKELPFELTEDQKKAIQSSLDIIRSGRRLNALVQGDVGSGKTIVALLLMIAFAENGYQAALMAPTTILARQHYEELSRLVEPYGLRTAFVSGDKIKAAELRELKANIASGEVNLIVGTQALLSDAYQFKNLALVITDEEHKYGVLQRKHLVDKAAAGVHTIDMSATPIPRTLAQIVYGNDLELFSIRTKPSGRKPVKTGIASSMEKVYDFILEEVNALGHQVYVVCPMISSSEKTEGIASAESVYEEYTKELFQYGVSVALVSGKTKKSEADEIFARFKANEISVLVSTTVIEVGVNVPNATCIVIHNAERFGLAQLHQLRGRVGRGSARGVCVLVSEEAENERLQAMCESTDGFKIAEMDLQQRGAGDLLGSQQSGNEKYLALALMYPEEYERAQAAAKTLMDDDEPCPLFEKAYRDFQEAQ